MVLIYALTLLVSVVSSVLLTWYLRGLAIRRGWVSEPPSERHLHRGAIPRLGGVAIYTSFILISCLVLLLAQLRHWDLGFPPIFVLYVFLPGTIIFCVGLYDDFHNAGPALKFGMQALAATMLYAGGFRVFEIRLFGMHGLASLLSLPLTIFWVLLITNAFNLIDGLDGLAAGSALFSTLTVFVLSLVSQNGLLSVVTICLAGAILGFLRFNFNPATIFLGDCGSLFVGFMLSALALAGAQKTPTIVAVAIPIVSFGLPIMDTGLAVFRRFLSGKPLFSADRQHVHHRLLQRGLTQRQAVLVLYAVSAFCGLLSLFLLYPGGQSIALVLFVLGLGILLGVQQLGYHEFFELKRLAQRTLDQKLVIANNVAIRHAAESLEDVTDAAQLERVLLAAFDQNDFDGFDLAVSRNGIAAEEGHRFQWRKDPAEIQKPAWWVTFELTDGDRRWGHFSLFRCDSQHPLLLDINLLSTTLQPAIAIALTRLSHSRSEKPAEAASPAGTTLSQAASRLI
jgi:UDP-GlcNAc:undecaprenyl-phosphate GlcNAc-1-phosphate transferase